MKFSIDIDCTPEEARAFFGLANVEELNKKIVEEIQARMLEHVRAMDPDALAKAWLPAGVKAWEQMQEAFLSGLGGGKGNKR